MLVRNCGIRGSNIYIRKGTLFEIDGFDETLAAAQDLDIAIRLADVGVRHRVNTRHRVEFHVHAGSRISTPGPANTTGNQAYLARHGRRMTGEQVRAFRIRTQQLFGCDPGPVPSLLWIVGPPGAGKSTWAQRIAAREGARVLEIADLLDWRDGATRGVSAAKGAIMQAIRAVELSRSEDDRRLFVVSAFFPPEMLRHLSSREHIVAIVPRREDWLARVIGRDGKISKDATRDYAWWARNYGVGVAAAIRAAEVAA
jgi:hypothetical protein